MLGSVNEAAWFKSQQKQARAAWVSPLLEPMWLMKLGVGPTAICCPDELAVVIETLSCNNFGNKTQRGLPPPHLFS